MAPKVNRKLLIAAFGVYSACGTAIGLSAYAETLYTAAPGFELPPPTYAQPKPVIPIRWPDIDARSSSTFVSGDNVTVRVKLRNRGDGTAGPFDVVATVRVGTAAPRTFNLRCPVNLAPGEEYEIHTTPIFTPLASRPVAFTIAVTADPVTAARPRGAVLESNENNNSSTTTSTIY